MIKVSIIMPLYNTAKYLSESIGSVLNQTLREFELICINDASTDDTLEILREFSKRDNRIKILTNETRSGAAYSRNRGIKEASGKYLSFLDGDDVFEEEMLECAYATAEEHHTDVVVFEMKHCISENIHIKQKTFHSELFFKRYCNATFKVKDQMPYEFMNWQLGPTNKLYNRKFILSNHLEFQNLSCENDAYFVCMSLMLAQRLLYLNDWRVMIYARDHDDLTRISYDRDPNCSYFAFLHIAEELKKRNKFSEVYPQYYYQMFYSVRNSLLKCRTEEKARDFYQFLQQEGIDRICSLGGEYYNQLDDFISNSLSQFKNQEFETQWYKEEQGLMIQLSQKRNAEAVINLFAEYQSSHKAIGVWGVGANGVSLLDFCEVNDLKIDMVIDRSKEKQGHVINGHIVMPPEEIGSKLQVVIITAKYIFPSIMEELSGRDIEVIDINQFLGIY